MELPGCAQEQGVLLDERAADWHPAVGVLHEDQQGSSESGCPWWATYIRKHAYTAFAQNNIVQAQYFKDPRQLDAYKRTNRFLRDINNEGEIKNPAYAQNLASLNRLVMVKFAADTATVPRESAWFGYYNGTHLLAMEEQEVYKAGWLGLERLNARGAVERVEVPGGHLAITDEFIEQDLVRWLD